MDFGIKPKCPYCGFEQDHTVEGGRKGTEVYTCDSFEGGCDRRFVIDWWLEVKISILKIEGEETKKQAAHGGDQG
jgi:transposase-like protein